MTIDAAESNLRDLALCDIPVYCILGTHDHNAANPYYSNSVDGIAWIKEQVRNEYLIELSASPTSVAGGPLDAYGISAENVGLDDVGKYELLGWSSSEITFGATSPGPNVLCLHDGVTPYREADANMDLEELLAESCVSFDCVLVGDEHLPKNGNFNEGYTFEAVDGTPVLYTGSAARIGSAYSAEEAFVTELTFGADSVVSQRFIL